MGAQTLGVAYPLLAMALTDSPVHAGWIAFALTIPGLFFYPPGGVLVDRINTRSLMLVTEALRTAAVASVFLALLLDMATWPHLLAAAVLEGTLWVLYSLAETALIPTVTESHTRLPGALARSETSFHLAVLTGRPAGGFLWGLAQAIPFAVNSLLFLVSLTSILRMPNAKRRQREEPGTEEETATGEGQPRLLREMADGLGELRRHRFLLQAIQVIVITNIAVNALLMIFIATSKTLAAWEVGMVLAAGGVGGFLGTWLSQPVANRLIRSPGAMLTVHAGASMIAVAIVSAGQEPLNFGLATLATGCAGAMINITIRTFEAQHVEPNKLARVASISRLASRGSMSLAAPIGGVLIAKMSAASAAWLLLLATGIGLALILAAWRTAEILAAWRTRRSGHPVKRRRAGHPAVGGDHARTVRGPVVQVTEVSRSPAAPPVQSFTQDPLAYDG